MSYSFRHQCSHCILCLKHSCARLKHSCAQHTHACVASVACRLQHITVSNPNSIDLDLLLRATSLDASQAEALVACLTRELAVVQGPPGCGEHTEHSTAHVQCNLY
jgi:hypothetical protein